LSGYGKEFGFIDRGFYTYDDLSLQIKIPLKHYKASTLRKIHSAWNKARLDPELNLYNGLVATFEQAEKVGDQLKVSLGMTDFKAFYGTNLSNYQALPPDQLANAIAVCGAVLTSDHTILMGKRSRKVAEGQEQWHVIGGTLELGESEYNSAIIKCVEHPRQPLKLSLNPFSRMITELEEELGINPDDLINISCLGIGVNLSIWKPEFLMMVISSLSSAQLLECKDHALNQGEHTEIVAVPIEDIKDFVYTHPVAPIGKAALFALLGFIRERDNWALVDLVELSARIGF